MDLTAQINQIKVVHSLFYEKGRKKEIKKKKKKDTPKALGTKEILLKLPFIRSKAMLFALVSSFSMGLSEVVYL